MVVSSSGVFIVAETNGASSKAATITKHLSPFISTTINGQQDETTVSYSPCGKTVLYAAGAGAAGYIAWKQYGYLIEGLIPALPTLSSSTDAAQAPRENQTAESQTPVTR